MIKQAAEVWWAHCAIVLGAGLVACSSDSDSAAGSDGGGADSSLPEVTIGIQDFPESKILAEVYGQELEEQGFEVSYKELGGYRDIVFSSFESGTSTSPWSTRPRRSSS